MPVRSTERDDKFIEAWHATGGSPSQVARLLNISPRGVFARRTNIEARRGISLPSSDQFGARGRGDGPVNDYLNRVAIDGFEGRMVVFSDAHYHPGIGNTIAHRALLEVIKEVKPKLIVANGDILDGARVSRFPRSGWENQPRMVDELDEVKERMAEVRHAYRGARLLRTIGNHDIRFDRYLSVNASEMEGIAGARLSDHLPAWQECMSIFINSNTMVKHRFGNGQHAAYMATLKAGTNTFSGHTHRLLTTPWGDYNGRRYGNETGALADVGGPQFFYTEDGPTSACSGFMVATFTKAGDLLYPEPCEIRPEGAVFRGSIVVRRPALKAVA